jgi:4-hydroxybenzoate polyprenyltransferase/Flp pilus assembly protein TadD
MRKGLSALVSELERSPLHPAYWALAFLALVTLRNVLEGALGPSGSVGFVYFSSPSALMVLDHFLFFYASVFLAIAVLLAALTRERVGRVMKATVPAWVLVLLPPFLDHLLTGGRGAKMTYLTDLSSVFLRFFDPGATFERVSQGQRVEIVAACLLAGAYARVKTRSWARAVLAFAGVYVVLALHGILPMAYARLTAPAALPGAAPELVYRGAFKSGGIVPDESRKLALLFLLSSSLLGWAAYAMHAPAKARAFLRNARPLRSVHYAGLAVFGIACGWALASPVGVAFGSGGDFLGVAGIVVAVFLAFQASVALNDLSDERGDRIVGARRPLVAGSLDRGDVTGFALATSAAALLFALNVKYSTFLLVVLALAVSFVYSAPPLRLKRVPLLATLALGCVSLLACLAGFTAFAEERAMAVFPVGLGWAIVLAFGLGFSAKDLKDVEGDRATGVLTLPVLLGPRAGRAAVAALVLFGYLVVPLIVPFRVLVVPAVVLGVASAAATLLWRHPRLDEFLLAACLAFTALTGFVSVRGFGGLVDPANRVVASIGLELRGRNAEAWQDWAVAADCYWPAASALPDDADLQRRAGAALSQAGRDHHAIEALVRAVELDPSYPVSREYLAASLSRLGHADEARAVLSTSSRENLQPRVFQALLGEDALERGDQRAAAAAFVNALRLGQPDIPARVRLAEILAGMGRKDSARRQFKAAVERRPDSAQAHDALARFCHVEGDLDTALREFGAAVRLDPGEPVFWNNLGTAQRSANDYAAALEAFATATRLAPRMVGPYYNRGQVHEAMGDNEEARRQYLLALELDPSFEPARQALERAERSASSTP